MATTKEQLMQQFNLGDEDFKETVRACKLRVKKNYSEEEAGRFVKARQLFDDGTAQSYDDIAEYFKAQSNSPDLVMEQIKNSDDPIRELAAQAGIKKADEFREVFVTIAAERIRDQFTKGQMAKGVLQELGDFFVEDTEATQWAQERHRQMQLEGYEPKMISSESSTESSNNESNSL